MIALILYLIGVYGAYLSLTQFAFDDLQGYEKAIPYVVIVLWPLALIWVLLLTLYEITIGDYLWKRQHRKWCNEKVL
jgi:hypothetical protein